MRSKATAVEPAPRRAANHPAVAPHRHRARRAKPPTFGEQVVAWLVPALVFALTFCFLYAFVARAFVVPSGSMEPTFAVGDRIIAQKMLPARRGDAIVFKDTMGWMKGEDNYLTKRLVGLPGDHVTCCTPAGNISVDGTEIVEPYLPQGTRPSAFPFDVVVPAGRLFVLGDHRNVSADSRCHLGLGDGAFIPVGDVVGSVPVVVFPFDHASLVPGSAQLAGLPTPTDAPASAIVKGKTPVC